MLHILIIDDSPTEVHVFKSILERNDIKVSVAVNAPNGISVKRQPRFIDGSA